VSAHGFILCCLFFRGTIVLRANARSKRSATAGEPGACRGPPARTRHVRVDGAPPGPEVPTSHLPRPDMPCALHPPQYQQSIESLPSLPSRRTCDGRRMRARPAAPSSIGCHAWPGAREPPARLSDHSNWKCRNLRAHPLSLALSVRPPLLFSACVRRRPSAHLREASWLALHQSIPTTHPAPELHTRYTLFTVRSVQPS
jgi:hypothetical protein